MKISDFDIDIPQELIAQRPLAARASSRMLVFERATGRIHHRTFSQLPEYVNRNDLLVANNSKVVGARIFGRRDTGGEVELLVLRRLAGEEFECLLRMTASKRPGTHVCFPGGMNCTILGAGSTEGVFRVLFSRPADEVPVWLQAHGKMPIPPYIRRPSDESDSERYQTIYSDIPGSVAAPTAGLHFSPEIVRRLEAAGLPLHFVTLHVGLGTFQPIKSEHVADHAMHSESFFVRPELWSDITATKKNGGRVLSVGTTTVRALESYARGIRGETSLFLQVGDRFLATDVLLTNFHQPRSTLIVLLAAFLGGRDRLLEIYRLAIAEKYRFFSYGDCLLVL